MIGLAYKQQCQTSFKWKPYTEELWQNTIRIDKAKDPNNTCPYCKNDNTTPVTDSSVLLSYKENPAFGGLMFKVFECHCCNAIFSWYKDK